MAEGGGFRERHDLKGIKVGEITADQMGEKALRDLQEAVKAGHAMRGAVSETESTKETFVRTNEDSEGMELEQAARTFGEISDKKRGRSQNDDSLPKAA